MFKNREVIRKGWALGMKRIIRYLMCVVVMMVSVAGQAEKIFAEGETDLDIGAQGAVIIDADTGVVLYGKNEKIPYYPASITKLMTALVVAEHCSMEENVIFSREAVANVEEGSGNSIQVVQGDKMTVRDCLYAMLLESSNQAANALAEHTAGSNEAFAIKMNAKADELGCLSTTFKNPSGLNDAAQMTTAYDMGLIAKAFFGSPQLKEIGCTRTYELPATQNNPEGYTLHMEHKLVQENDSQEYSYVSGGKTGYTSQAGNTLVTYAQKDSHNLIAVVLNCQQTHYEDTVKLLEYAFANYSTLVENGQPVVSAAPEPAALVQEIPEVDVDALNTENEQAAGGFSISFIKVAVAAVCLILIFNMLRIMLLRRRKRLLAIQRRRRIRMREIYREQMLEQRGSGSRRQRRGYR